MSARDVDGAGDAALLPLLALADVHEQRCVIVFQQLLGAAGVHLFDRSLGFLQQVPVARHGFRLYSGHISGRKRGGYGRAVYSRSRVTLFVTFAALTAAAAVV